jgi:hypothetical protein
MEDDEGDTYFFLRTSVRTTVNAVVLASSTISFIGSFLVVWLLARKIARWNSVNIFIVAIAIADLFFAVAESIFPLKYFFNFMVFDDQRCRILLCFYEPEWLRFPLVSSFIATAALKVELQRRTVFQLISSIVVVAIILLVPTAFQAKAYVFSDENETYCATYIVHRERLQMSIEASIFVATALTCLAKFKNYRSSSDKLIQNLPIFYLVISICWLPMLMYDSIYYTFFVISYYMPNFFMIAHFLKYLIPVVKMSFYFSFHEDLKKEMRTLISRLLNQFNSSD